MHPPRSLGNTWPRQRHGATDNTPCKELYHVVATHAFAIIALMQGCNVNTFTDTVTHRKMHGLNIYMSLTQACIIVRLVENTRSTVVRLVENTHSILLSNSCGGTAWHVAD